MTIAERARKLRLDRRSHGDHGFTGKALRRWKRQRTALKVLLRVVEASRLRRVSASDPRRRGMLMDCPREIQPKHGTKGGAEWVVDVHFLVVDCTDYMR